MGNVVSLIRRTSVASEWQCVGQSTASGSILPDRLHGGHEPRGSCNAASSPPPHNWIVNTSIISQVCPKTTAVSIFNIGALVQTDLLPRPILILRSRAPSGYLSEKGFNQSAPSHQSTPTEASSQQLSDRPKISSGYAT